MIVLPDASGSLIQKTDAPSPFVTKCTTGFSAGAAELLELIMGLTFV